MELWVSRDRGVSLNGLRCAGEGVSDPSHLITGVLTLDKMLVSMAGEHYSNESMISASRIVPCCLASLSYSQRSEEYVFMVSRIVERGM